MNAWLTFGGTQSGHGRQRPGLAGIRATWMSRRVRWPRRRIRAAAGSVWPAAGSVFARAGPAGAAFPWPGGRGSVGGPPVAGGVGARIGSQSDITAQDASKRELV
jgi:hypothetical protein